MNKVNTLALASALTGLIAVAGSVTAPPAEASGAKEKCYGVAKAGKNDCATKTTSCAGSAKEDGQKDAFIMVPKGLCDRLNGGAKESV